jgi:hypothetical protein
MHLGPRRFASVIAIRYFLTLKKRKRHARRFARYIIIAWDKTIEAVALTPSWIAFFFNAEITVFYSMYPTTI